MSSILVPLQEASRRTSPLSRPPLGLHIGDGFSHLLQKDRTGLETSEQPSDSSKLARTDSTQRLRENKKDGEKPATDIQQVVESWLLNESYCFLKADLCS